VLPAPGWSFSGLARLLHRGVGHGNHTVPRFARLPGRRLVSGDPASRSRGSRAPEVLRSRTSRRTRGLYAPEGLSPSPSGTGALQAPEPFRHRSPSGTGVLQTPESFRHRRRSRLEAVHVRRPSGTGGLHVRRHSRAARAECTSSRCHPRPSDPRVLRSDGRTRHTGGAVLVWRPRSTEGQRSLAVCGISFPGDFRVVRRRRSPDPGLAMTIWWLKS